MKPLSSRAYGQVMTASSWEEIWEAGPYYDRVSELLEDAREYAVFVGWQIDSRLRLKRPFRSVLEFPSETLKEKILRICSEKPHFHFYFLLWDHAYFYVFERETWQGRVWEDIHPRVHFLFDNRHPLGASHHEKVTVFDGRVALCGGIDLCDDRWDSVHHHFSDPRRSLNGKEERHGPYHDLAVQVTGPICVEIQEHISKRWRELTSIPFPVAPRPESFNGSCSLGHRVYLSRTLVEVDAHSARGLLIREVEFLFRDLIQAAEFRIILEGQYYWSQALNDMLMAKILKMEGKKFEIIIILADLREVESLTRHMMVYELTLLRQLILAAQYSGVSLKVGSPYVLDAPQGMDTLPPKPVYIHSKIVVIDDRFLGIGSANFATRALRLDTEIHLTLEATTSAERNHIRRVSQALLIHWNLDGENKNALMHFRFFRPEIEIEYGRSKLDLILLAPLSYLFDPMIPWFLPLKIRYHKWVSQMQNSIVLAMVLIWTLELIWLGFLVGASPSHGFWKVFYGSILASAWLLPVPYLFVLVMVVCHLGCTAATRLGIFAFWIAAALGYSMGRVFPRWSRTLLGAQAGRRILQRMKLRDFAVLMSVLLDPRVSLRTKMIYQGLYCVPLPWFLLSTGLVLPALLYTGLRGVDWLVQTAYPFHLPIWMDRLRNYGGLLVFGVFTMSLLSIGWHLTRGQRRL